MKGVMAAAFPDCIELSRSKFPGGILFFCDCATGLDPVSNYTMAKREDILQDCCN